MSAANSALDLTMHLINMGGNSDGGWIPGNGLPTSQIGIVGNRYVDVQTGNVYGPKTRTGWPEEAITNEVNGYLVEVDDVAGLVESVSRVLDVDDAAWREMSQAAFLTVADSSWAKSCAQFEAVLRRACQ